MSLRQMRKVRRMLVERLEPRVVLDGGGLAAATAPLESVIVVFDNGVADPLRAVQEVLGDHCRPVDHVYGHALRGVSLSLPPAAIEALRGNPHVRRIEPNVAFQITAQTLPTGIDRIDADLNSLVDIDQGVVPEPLFDVDIAILDTGIDGSHTDLNVYAAGSRNFVSGLSDSAWHDGHGHGTHVAGIAAAVDNDYGVVGVAPGARVWALKVLNDQGYGTIAEALAAVDYVTQHADQIEVANMSFGEYAQSLAFHEAIQNAVAAGVVFVAAAGNDSRDIFGSDDAYNTFDDFIPAAYPEVLTASALTDHDGQPGGSGGSWFARLLYGADDGFANYSNFSGSTAPGNPVISSGAGIDLIAPGTQIYSTNTGGGYTTKGGTSMAAPHAAGLAALYVSEFSQDLDGDGMPEYGDLNGDGALNEADVYAVRQSLINRAKEQTDAAVGLVNGGDPDAHLERIAWAGPTGPNTAPDATGEQATTDAGSAIVIDVLSNDADPDGDPLWVTIMTPPAHGKLVVNADHTLLYTPSEGFTGTDVIEYAAHDGMVASSPVAVSIQVGPGNALPVAEAGGPYEADEGETVLLDGSLSSDPDGELVAYAWDLDDDGQYDDALGSTAAFSSTVDGSFTVGLRVTDDTGGIATDTALVNVYNVAPTADAGGPYWGDEGSDILLSASASTDPGNDISSYAWDFDGDGAYDDASGVSVAFNTTADGMHTVGLRVADDDGASSIHTAAVTVYNVAPTADAGGPYTVAENVELTLDASASSDPGDDITLYEWDLDGDEQFDDAVGVSPAYLWPNPGQYTIQVRVTDDTVSDVATTTVTVTETNDPPVAEAGGPYFSYEGSTVELDASASTDVGGSISSYEWDLDHDGQYDDATGVTVDFSATADGSYTVGLRVTDNLGATSIDTASVTVYNQVPVADAGGPYAGNEGSSVALSAAGSSDPGNDIATYEWDLDADGLYDDATGVSTTFPGNQDGEFTVSVLVTDDDGASADATATVTIHNLAPTADAGGPYSAEAGVPVTLDASGSSDPGQDPLSYAWELNGDGLYDDAAGVYVSHTWADPGSYSVEVRVSDDTGAATTDTATVTVASASSSAYTTIDLTKQTFSRWWRATATVTVALGDQPGGQLLDSAEVSGHWSGVYNSSVAGQTDKNGVVSFRTSFVRAAGELVFMVDSVRKDTQTYVLYGESQDSISNGTASATSGDRSLLTEFVTSSSSAGVESASSATQRREPPASSPRSLEDTVSAYASDTSATLHYGHNTEHELALLELLAESESPWNTLELDGLILA